ncbi:MAG: lipid-binding SYLF domain-containing protein [Bryobacterales bacterium]|nr:lipid-binding SYLF domain-containing protein [Bryobacterales bacterium]
MRKTQYLLLLTFAAVLPAVSADDTAARLSRSATVLSKMIGSTHGIPAEKLANADCVAVIPGFKKGAAVIGVGYGRGFISCRNGNNWSAPGAIAFETGSLGIQLGGEQIDIVVLSFDAKRRSKLLSDRFVLGSDASAAWGNGKSAHEDPNVEILFYGRTKGLFAGFGLDGATLKTDESGNKALYGKAITNSEIVDQGVELPAGAQPLITKLGETASR